MAYNVPKIVNCHYL